MADLDLVPASWDGHNINDGTNYQSGFAPALEWGLPAVVVRQAPRLGRWPVTTGIERTGRRIYLVIKILGSSVRTLRDQLLQWFDPEDEDPKNFAIKDEDGSGTRYVTAVCENLVPEVVDVASARLFTAVLVVHGDVRWRDVSPTSDEWNITASGQTNTIANNGTDDAYPVYTVKPTNALGAGQQYKVPILIRWRRDVGYDGYPTDIADDSLDTATAVGAGKMQADGDDLRVIVNGVEDENRWLQNINDATTQVWVNLDFKARQEGTLATAIAAVGAVSTIDLNESIAGFPDAGILVINSEAFAYTGKTESDKQFTGVTRSVNGTSAGAHSVNDTVWWCQHDLWIVYGDSTLSAPGADDDYKPAFELSSTNTSWVYAVFGDDNGKRAGAWQRVYVRGSPTFYNGNQDSDATPWAEIGLTAPVYGCRGRWRLYNPCELTNANFTNGEKWSDSKANFTAHISSSKTGRYPYTVEYTIPVPSADSTWEAWSRDEALISGSKYVSLYCKNLKSSSVTHKVEAADCTITLDSSYTPAITVGSEESTYDLDCIITNNTTGESLEVFFTEIALNEELEIDTDTKTVTHVDTGLSAFQALRNLPARRDWLRLQPGNNELEFTATGTSGVTLTTEFYQRWY